MHEGPVMRDELPHDLDGRRDNVGALDATVRAIAALLVPLGAAALLARWHPDWVFTILIHGLILTAYLGLTAAGRFDPFYEALGWTTEGWHPRRRHRGEGRMAG